MCDERFGSGSESGSGDLEAEAEACFRWLTKFNLQAEAEAEDGIRKRKRKLVSCDRWLTLLANQGRLSLGRVSSKQSRESTSLSKKRPTYERETRNEMKAFYILTRGFYQLVCLFVRRCAVGVLFV